MIKNCHIYILLTVLLTIAGCARETEMFPEPTPAYKIPIRWSIEQGETRALVNNNLLQESCTPAEDGSNESIGIWGDFTTGSSGEEVSVKEFVATPLTYITGTFNSWEYPGEARYWESQAIYNFRACYPQKLMTTLMTQMDATMFQGGPINTMAMQDDILVAATQVDTRTARLSEPVRLNMQHIFAAIMFKVKACDGFVPPADEGVTSCWLQNSSSETNLFSPAGYLVHSGNALPEIKWHPYESSQAPMYVWKHQGVSFSLENTLYTQNGGMQGEEFTHNDGWLLVVPQTVKAGTLNFCYTLNKAGYQVFSVNIPQITYEPGKKYTYVLEIRGSKVELKLTIKPWNHLESSYDISI